MNYDETITTLQFASRAIKIKVNAKINEKIELKKIRDKLKDLNKIKNMDLIILENKKLENEANDLKSNFSNLKNELKRVRSKKEMRSKSSNRDEENDANYKSLSNMSKHGGYNTNNIFVLFIEL